jgi:phosphoglycolate phosphatase-like HAD superfamily hydrolase
MSRHIVWDWNGTLLDDLHVVIEAVNLSMGALGLDPIDEHGYRDHFTRPVRAFYDSVLGRLVGDDEWERLNQGFHDHYFTLVTTAQLAPDAERALSLAEEGGWGQSLLSMSPQSHLESVVASSGIAHYFGRIDGLSGTTGGVKARHLEEHLSALDVAPGRVVVIGDTPDDAAAARHVGASVVLYDGGSHHIPILEEVGAPLAHTLIEAVELAGEFGVSRW